MVNLEFLSSTLTFEYLAGKTEAAIKVLGSQSDILIGKTILKRVLSQEILIKARIEELVQGLNEPAELDWRSVNGWRGISKYG